MSEPLRVVYVWDSDYPWDVRTEKICRSLSEFGCEVHIVARNRRWLATTEQLGEGRVHRMRPWRLIGKRLDGMLGFPAFFSPRWRALIASVVNDVRPHVVVVRDLPLCPVALAVGRRAGVPVVLDMAEHYPAIMQEIWTSGRQRPLDYLVRNPRAVAAVERHCVARVDHVLTTAAEASARLRNMGVEDARLSVVHNTPPKSRALEQLAKEGKGAREDGALEIVYLGLLEVPRGIKDLIDASIVVARGGQKVRLLVIGGGRDEQIFRAYAQERGLGDDAARFFGHVEYSQAMKMVAAADIGVLPIHVNDHLNTTVPNKLFDYMSVGLPVITSDSEPSARIVRETGCGEVYRDRSVEDLAAAIVRLGDADVRAAKGAAGREAVLSHYNWDVDSQSLARAVALATSRKQSIE